MTRATPEELAKELAVAANVPEFQREQFELWCAVKLREWTGTVVKPAADDMKFQQLLLFTSEVFDVSLVEMLSKDQRPHVAQARFALASVLREKLSWSYPKIGRALGKRDHTTIMNGIQKAGVLERGNLDFAQRIRMLREAA